MSLHRVGSTLRIVLGSGPVRRWPAGRTLRGALIAVAVLPASARAGGEPKLPGAVVDPPAWLVQDAPFDMARFFAMPRPEENAAPLYLDALLEFGPDVSICFPSDARDRAAVARGRDARLKAIWSIWTDDPGSVDRARRDALIDECAEGLRKIDLAQRRPRCVFAIGITYESLLPHAQVARNVARLLALQAHRDLDRGDVGAAIGRIETGLRLSRDLRPREPIIGQLVSIAIDATLANQVVPLILAHPRITPSHCDRLIAVLVRHEAEAIDPYATAIRGEYVVLREIVRRFEAKVRVRVGADGRPVDEPVSSGQTLKELLDNVDDPKAKTATTGQFDAAVAATLHGIGIPKDREALIGITRELLAPASTSANVRSRAFAAIEAKYLAKDAPDGTTLLRLTTPAIPVLITSAARDAFYLRSAQALLALRRWELTHRTPPPSLGAACADAKMRNVPIDPFSDGPLKLATVDGGTVVYSIGPDGRDDHAQVDSEKGKKPEGDLIYRLPKRK